MSQPNKLKKLKAKSPSPPVDSSVGASTTPKDSKGGITTDDVLRNTSTLLEVLKSVSDAAQILGPLKAICGVLKIAADTAILLQNNGEDLKDLIEKLEPQQRFLESEIEKLSKPEFSKLEHMQDLVEPLWRYLLALKNVHDRLDTLKSRYEGGKMKRVKSMLMAQADHEQIAGYTQKLEDSFRLFVNSVTNFIARQTLLMRNEIAALHKNMAEMSASMTEKDAKDALSKLAYVNARGNQHETCAEGTRTDMLEKIAQWATDVNAEPMLALVDQAGTGKSTIATHMMQKWEKEGSLLSRFFFSKPSTVTANGLASTLAKDLTKNVPSLRPVVLAALEEHDDFTSCPLQQQLEWLVFTPLRSLKEPRVMVIDALDECSKADRNVLLKSILDFVNSFDGCPCPLKVLLTSRPEDDIVSRVREPRYAKSIHRVNFSLHSKDNASNEADIQLFMTRLLSNYLTTEQLELLVKRANGLFIWASTAQALITSALDPTARFEKLMEKDSSLNTLYDDVLNAALESARDEKETVMRVLQAICVAREPLTVEMMDELLGLRSGIAQRVVIKLSSVLSDASHGAPIYVLHPTFLEYLQSVLRDPPIVTIAEAEALMAKGCLKVLLSGLKFNICDISQPGTSKE